MEKLKERFLKFRYNGILAIVLIFIVIALIVFIERSGISVNYTKRVLDYLPKEKIVTKERAQINSQKNTVLLYNSLSASSSNALEEFKFIFTDMKVGYELIDLSMEQFPDLNKYKIAVVLTEDLTVFGDNVFTLCDWVYDGGSTLFAVSLSKSVYTTSMPSGASITQPSITQAQTSRSTPIISTFQAQVLQLPLQASVILFRGLITPTIWVRLPISGVIFTDNQAQSIPRIEMRNLRLSHLPRFIVISLIALSRLLSNM